ncbi:hypothetical protein Ait01nite_024350 [Actinoplanes italicus]|uniref:Uncharacterized protein n=1 Tax=Actinoplanes italicus TaxID=113567 RepID=A0A2T0KFP0_9ACTN|nr:hypothetical protein [Actinoplanes italicus]PRX22190.1 hypothetical protein CLV67_105367 [Actinoplanes italicus]GIE29390.1 hypothetical protein Ait01nite_024350 [Actinoplanes italicus]
MSDVVNRMVAAGFGLVTVVLVIVAGRCLMLGVVVTDDRILVRRLGRTYRIRWSEVIFIGPGRLSSGVASLTDMTIPVIEWQRPGDRKSRRTELNILGGYGILGSGPRLTERALADLGSRWEKWRAENGPVDRD